MEKLSYAIDAGMNKGLWTDANLDKFDKIIGIEANPALFNYLKDKYKDNPKVEVLNYAVTDKNGPVTFNICREADTISSCSEEWLYDSRFSDSYSWYPITVEGITVDELISRYGEPTLIKADVENWELEVFLGLSKKIPMVCWEIAEEGREKIILTVKHLQSLGFESFSYCECDDYNFIPTVWSEWENLGLEEILQPNRKSWWGMAYAK